MTKMKNTKKGMAKKALSISLVAAMLATSNVPVWAAFDAEDPADVAVEAQAFEAGAPVVDEVAPAILDEGTETLADDTAIQGNIKTPATVQFGAEIKPDYSGITPAGTTLKYQWQKKTGDSDWENVTTNGMAATYTVAWSGLVGEQLRVIAYTGTLGSTESSVVSDAIVVQPIVLSESQIKVTVLGNYQFNAGTVHHPDKKDLTVKLDLNGTEISVNDNDYDITGYGDNVNVGKGSVTIALLEKNSGYSGTATGTFDITAKDTNTLQIPALETGNKQEYVYTGKAITPTGFVVKNAINGVVLTEGTDYEVLPLDGVNAGKYTVTIVGKNAYAGFSATSKWTAEITAKDIKDCRIVVTPKSAAQPKTKVEIFDDSVDPDTPLKGQEKGQSVAGAVYEYELINDGEPNVTAIVKISADINNNDNYKGTTQTTYSNDNIDITTLDAFKTDIATYAKTWSDNHSFTGAQQNPIEAGAKFGGLIVGRDFTAEIVAGGTDAGEMSIKFTGIGSYKGIYTTNAFSIKPIWISDGIQKGLIAITPASDDNAKIYYNPSVVDKDGNDVSTNAMEYPAPELKMVIKSTGYVLEEGKDYVIDRDKNNTNGTKTVLDVRTAADTGSSITFTGSKNTALGSSPVTRTYTLTAKDIKDADVIVSEIPAQPFTGTAVKPDVTLTYKGITYIKKADYDKLSAAEKKNYRILENTFDVVYSNNTNLGENTASVTIKPIQTNKNYTGTKTVKFSIIGATLAGGKIVNSIDQKADLPSVGYTKEAAESKDGITLNKTQFLVLDKNGVVVPEKYYDVIYSNNKAVGTATITITGKNGYEGTLTSNFKIAANGLPMDTLTMTNVSNTHVYTGNEVTLEKDVDYTLAGALGKLTEGTDYTVKYENNTNAGTAKMIIQGINSYYGSITQTFTIQKTTITKQNISVGDAGYAAGQEVKPSVVISIPGTSNTLKEGVDYTLEYAAAKEVGKTGTITINYNTDTKKGPVNVDTTKSVNKVTYTVNAMDLADVTINDIDDQKATGEQIKPAVVVMNGNIRLVEGTDYEVVYGDNVEAGEGTVTIKALSSNKNYTGEQTKKFNIIKDLSETAPVISATLNRNEIDVTVDETVEGATAYDYVLCKSEEDLEALNFFKSNRNVDGTASAFLFVRAGEYKVYARAIVRDEDGKKSYSDWSEAADVSITTETPNAATINKVTVNGNKVTVTFTPGARTQGVDVMLGQTLRSSNGEPQRPVTSSFSKYLQKNLSAASGKRQSVTFTNVAKGTHYIGVHPYIMSSDELKYFGRWSQQSTATKVVIK